jgi:hypothetical protein
MGDPMRQEKKKIYNHFLEYQQRFGGYTGKDLDETARNTTTTSQSTS